MLCQPGELLCQPKIKIQIFLTFANKEMTYLHKSSPVLSEL